MLKNRLKDQKYFKLLEEFIQHHLHVQPVSTNVNEEIDKVIQKCLEKAVKDRYQNFTELERTLADIYFSMTGEKIETPTDDKRNALDLANKGISLDNLGMTQEAIMNLKEVPA